MRRNRLVAWVTVLTLTCGLAAAQDFGGLNRSEAPRAASAKPVAGVDFPLLELDSDFKLIGSRTTVFLTEKGQRRQLAVIDQGLLQSLGEMYSIRRERGGPVIASMNWQVITFDPAGKIVLRAGDLNQPEIGRVRQRVVFSVGTGLDIYRTGEKPVGHVQEKVLENLQNLFVPSLWTRKYYSFQKLAYRDVVEQVPRGFGRNRRMEDKTKTVTDTSEPFKFLGAGMGSSGPGGVFVDAKGQPVLGVKGDWWVSKHIFDLVVKRKESEGAAGQVGTAISILLGGETDEQRRQRVKRENELVKNSTGYLGAFLAGLVYFPEFRKAVGVELPISE